MVTSTFPRWSDDTVPHFVLDMATDLVQKGWQVDVLAPHCDGALAREEMDGVNVTRFRYLWPAALETLAYGEGGAIQALRRKPWNALKLPFFFLGQLIALHRLTKQRQTAVINSHWLVPQGLAASIVSRLSGLPHVATVHGGDVLGLTSAPFLQAKRLALKKCSACTVNSSVTEAAVRALAPSSLRIERIPPGAEPLPPAAAEIVRSVRDRYARTDEVLLLFVGRLIPQKGCDHLLAAMKIIAGTRSDARLLIAGDGPERRSLERAAAESGIAERIEFTGWLGRDELISLYRAADLFVASPARGPGGETEAFGLVFVEAALAGLPTVATRSGGIADIVIDGDTGVLVAENDPQDFARAVLGLLSDQELAQRMGEAARTRAEARFTRARAATAFSSLFEEIAGGRAR